MLKTITLSSSTFFYYDIERKILARFPSKSNLLEEGSDNSLYFGMIKNEDVCKIFKEIFEIKNIKDLVGTSYLMHCKGSEEIVEVKININKEGQIQIKICKNGTMYRLTNEYSFMNFINNDFTKMLLVVDFKNREIRFKNPLDFKL